MIDRGRIKIINEYTINFTGSYLPGSSRVQNRISPDKTDYPHLLRHQTYLQFMPVFRIFPSPGFQSWPHMPRVWAPFPPTMPIVTSSSLNREGLLKGFRGSMYCLFSAAYDVETAAVAAATPERAAFFNKFSSARHLHLPFISDLLTG